MTTESTFKNTVIEFELGKEFEEETVDGRQVKSVITMDGENKLIHEQGGEKPSTIIREFTDKLMTATMKVEGVTAVRVYEAQ